MNIRDNNMRLLGSRARFLSISFLMIVANSAYSEAQSTSTNLQEFVGEQIGGPNVNLDKDEFGRTKGTVGENQVDVIKDEKAGHTTGTFGNSTVDIYTDQFGNVTGLIGGKSVNLQKRDGGLLEGNLNGKRIVCDRDPFDNIVCKQ